MSTARHSAFTRATRSRSSGRFHASAWSSTRPSGSPVVVVEEAHRRAPLLEERHVGRVQLALALDQALGEPLEHPHQQVLHRAEVVVDEAVVDAGLLREAPGRDAGVADLDEQPLRRVEELVLGLRPGGPRDRHQEPPLRLFFAPGTVPFRDLDV